MLTTQKEKKFRIKMYYFINTTACLTKQPRLQVSSVVSEWEKWNPAYMDFTSQSPLGRIKTAVPQLQPRVMEAVYI